MHIAKSRLRALWDKAATDLDLEIVSPFELVLNAGVCIRVPLLIRQFGGKEGILVLSDYSHVSASIDAIMEAGYGFSVMSEPSMDEEYVREDFIDVLVDWGWSGADSKRPSWLAQNEEGYEGGG